MRSNVANNAPEVSDITVTLLDNQGNPQGTQVVYKECYPLALDQVELDSGGEVHDIIGTLTIVCNDLSMQVKLDEKTILSYPDDYGSV
jgi:hypothetical protein